jgi:hypothetical protein
MVVHREDGLAVSIHLWDVGIRDHGEIMIKDVYPGTDVCLRLSRLAESSLLASKVALLCFHVSYPVSLKRIGEVWLPEVRPQALLPR